MYVSPSFDSLIRILHLDATITLLPPHAMLKGQESRTRELTLPLSMTMALAHTGFPLWTF